MGDVIRLGISTCPNDTFAFHGLLERRVSWRGLEFRVELMDVQECNEKLRAGALDVAKASFFAALSMSEQIALIPVGTALGFGVGPVLLARPGTGMPGDIIAGRPARVLCPGEWTTANLLYALFHGGEGVVEQAVFSEIIPALVEDQTDFGVCIHEGRFTYENKGLRLVEDLGATWERQTGAPLPLGGIMGRLDLGDHVLGTVCEVIRDSLRHGHAHPDETLPTMRRHAQELDDAVIQAHVDLYVNEWTTDLGDVGRRAIGVLDDRAREAGLISPSAPPLRVLD